MSETSVPTLTASDYLSEPLRASEPDVVGSLAVYPIFGPGPQQPYVSFAQGREQGVAIKELESGASVNDLLVMNPTHTPVLLFEGEEVIGAQQNRTFNVTALIDAHSQHQLPVSCVEAGRWDSSRHAEDFAPSPQMANIDLRRRKAVMVNDSLAAGGPARARQSEVWNEIEAKRARLAAFSETGAMHDVYESRRDRLNRINDAVTLRDGQSGALVALGGSFLVLDWVSRSEVFASLHTALVQGYGLDAIEAQEAPAPSVEEAEGFVALATRIRTSERDGVGLGREVRFHDSRLLGTGLAAAEELLQLTVHAENPSESGDLSSGRIRRPSRRRLR